MAIEREEREATKSIELGLGRSIQKGDDIGLAAPTKWPELKVPDSHASLVVRMALAEKSLAEAQSTAAQSEIWPDVRIGPSFEREIESEKNSFGVAFGVTIPIWNSNRPARELAQARLAFSSRLSDAARTGAARQFELTVHAYKTSTTLLAQSETLESISRSLRNSERVFSRGLIPPPSMIEMYRSSMDLIEEIHKNELVAFTAWSTLHLSTDLNSMELP